MAKRRCTVEIQNIQYSLCRRDDTDKNVVSRDMETRNRSIEFNDAMIMITLCIEMCQRVVGSKNISVGTTWRSTDMAFLRPILIYQPFMDRFIGRYRYFQNYYILFSASLLKIWCILCRTFFEKLQNQDL